MVTTENTTEYTFPILHKRSYVLDFYTGSIYCDDVYVYGLTPVAILSRRKNIKTKEKTSFCYVFVNLYTGCVNILI